MTSILEVENSFSHSHLQEVNKDQDYSFVSQKVVIRSTFDIQKVSTEKNATPAKEDKNKTKFKNISYLQNKTVYGKVIDISTNIHKRRNMITMQRKVTNYEFTILLECKDPLCSEPVLYEKKHIKT